MLKLPEQAPLITAGDHEVLVVTNADLRESANVTCWPTYADYSERLDKELSAQGYKMIRAHAYDEARGHGFIASQKEGSALFAQIDPEAPVIVLLTAWQYSHHLVPSLATHKGPILLLANFDGTWPGLVGMLCMAGSLTSMGVEYSRLWSDTFADDFFKSGLATWLKSGKLDHDLSYLQDVPADHPVLKTEAGKDGVKVGEYILRNKAILGLFDTMCMGMMNGFFPLKALTDIGMPLEGLSQSALLVEMAKVPQDMREDCLKFYEDRGMQFQWGSDSATELTRDQVLEQCAMMIAMGRFVKRFGLTAVGVQYQQGLKDCCPASDFAEGAIGSTERFPIPDEDGSIICEGKPIPCVNEVDMGTAIPQAMLFRLLDAMGLPAETTLHDVRWGSEYEGTFYWDFEISGSVPFEHLKGGLAGAKGFRQPPMYFPKGGSTIGGQCRAGKFVWARAHYEGTQVIMQLGTGVATELPEAEFQRRLDATTPEWPLMNATLDGVGRDDLMAGHQSNHITIAYVPDDKLQTVLQAFVAQALTQGIKVKIAGSAKDLL